MTNETEPREEMFVETPESEEKDRSEKMKSPMRMALELLGIFIAMYLAVGAIVHMVSSLEAVAAIAPDSSMAVSAVTTASASQADANESDAFGEPMRSTTDFDDCELAAGRESHSKQSRR